MGTTVSIDVREPLVEPAAARRGRRLVPRRRRALLAVPARQRGVPGGVGRRSRSRTRSPDVRAMFTLADELRERTGGYFDPRGHRADRRPDPTGVVKGWAVDEAGRHPPPGGRPQLPGGRGRRPHRRRGAGAGPSVAHRHPAPGPRGPGGRRPASARSRRRHVRAVRAGRAHPRPAHGRVPGGLRSADGHRPDARPRGRLRDDGLRHGGSGHRLGGRPARVRRGGHHGRRPRRVDAERRTRCSTSTRRPPTHEEPPLSRRSHAGLRHWSHQPPRPSGACRMTSPFPPARPDPV